MKNKYTFSFWCTKTEAKAKLKPHRVWWRRWLGQKELAFYEDKADHFISFSFEASRELVTNRDLSEVLKGLASMYGENPKYMQLMQGQPESSYFSTKGQNVESQQTNYFLNSES